jgi:hypothetical protein
MASKKIPEGFREDSQGRLIAIENIKEIDQLRDGLVQEIVEKARVVHATLAHFKAEAFGDIAAFISLSAEKYRVQLGGQKGNVTLLSFDGRYKIQRAVAESITFDERLKAAKELIDECLREWTDGARSEIRTLITDAFRVDQEGNIRTGNVLALRRLEITDERWMRAMQAISDAVQIVGSKSYVRVYERDDASGQYKQLSLDVSGV